MKNILFYEEGQKFGNLTFIKDYIQINNEKRKPRQGIFKCFCGNEFITRVSGVKGGKVKSCGCTRKLKSIARFKTHGLSNSITYSSWECMKARCINPHNKFYPNYGGRGIKVCDRWMKFENFLEDMGERPSKKYSIDRKDVNKDYCIDNCMWSDRYTQDRNRTNTVHLEYKGETYVLKDLARMFNLHYQTLQDRIKKGMSVEEALNKQYKYVKKNEQLL